MAETAQTKLNQADQFLTLAVEKQFPRLNNFSHFERFLLLNILLVIVFLFFSLIRKISFKGMIDRFINIVFKVFYAKSIPEKLEVMKNDIIKAVPEYGRSKLTTIPYKPPAEEMTEHAEK